MTMGQMNGRRKSRVTGRRRFLAGGLAAGAGGLSWAGVSSSWPARFIRERIDEIGRDVPPAVHTPAPASWDGNAITLAWLGHATVLIDFYGVRILTDPTLFNRIGVDLRIGSLGPLRQVRCALTPETLPEIDLVLVSHAHFDHLDTPSLSAIRGRPAAVMARNTSDLLPRRRYSSATELGWGEHTVVHTARGDVNVRGIEVKHWGARLRSDTYRGWTGFVIAREGKRLLIGGDTAHTASFRSHRTLGPFEAAVMPIGAYDPWIWNHCTPEQAVAMADAAGARLLVPVHHQTFKLSREGAREPIERVEAALAREHGRLALRDVGETVRIS
jgi:L-ascorbate metabolism protein UlaG (beta-lactamase superfamily)